MRQNQGLSRLWRGPFGNALINDAADLALSVNKVEAADPGGDLISFAPNLGQLTNVEL